MLAPEARGRGLGTQASLLTLDHAFHVTNLRMVWLKVLAPNKAGIHAYEKAGFCAAGTIREAGYWLGQVCDELVMDALSREFSGPSQVTPCGPDRAPCFPTVTALSGPASEVKRRLFARQTGGGRGRRRAGRMRRGARQ
ncbi:Acetyltransferase (GNAT) family protein [Streptomyces yunnanensis]|uniref:Acetyltransferase (GNAT) family protein n=2 Tax=Streptomyces yunnanensis TaxID=156453 RepID=A0A9X8QZE3_9ACTN|nr:Acetyltransferase (GNAT) family protein [Streptomyces yunnanensis]